tara:strand:+ start:788 stop:2497 length:1710 start_codon:yes stop_codon:yes gene_type:complete
MATMADYLREMELRVARGWTPGVPTRYTGALSTSYAPFSNLGALYSAAQPKPNLGDIAAASNPAVEKKPTVGRPRLTPEQIQRTASRLGQGTVKALPAVGVAYELLRSEPAVASELAPGINPTDFRVTQAYPSMAVDDPTTPVVETYPNVPTLPGFDISPDAGGAVGGDWNPLSVYPNQIGITPPAQPRQELSIENLAGNFQPNLNTALASTPSGFMPPGTGLGAGWNPFTSGFTLDYDNPYTPEMAALDKQQDLMASQVANSRYYDEGLGSWSIDKNNIFGLPEVTVPSVYDYNADWASKQDPDVLAAAQVDTFRPVEQLRMDRPRTTSSISDYLPSFISTASAANTFEDSTYPGYQDYLADEKWHGMGIGNVKTGPGSKDFENWMVSQRTEETPVLPDFNTAMFNDIFTDEVAMPRAMWVDEADDSYKADDFIGRMYRDEKAADNVEKFVGFPAQPAPVVQTRRTTPAPVVTPPVTETAEIAAMVREIEHRNAVRDQVTRDLMETRDRGTPSHAEVQAAINAMMGNEFGGLLALAGAEGGGAAGAMGGYRGDPVGREAAIAGRGGDR